MKRKAGKDKKQPVSTPDVEPAESVTLKPEIVITMMKDDYVVDDSEH